MNRLIYVTFLIFILCCNACRSWRMNEHSNVYLGCIRSFDIHELKLLKNENRLFRLEMYNDSVFRLTQVSGFRPWKSGTGIWYDYGDYIILEFNSFDRDREYEKLEESLLGVTFIHASCMVLKKRGRKDLKVLPSNAVLRNSN